MKAEYHRSMTEQALNKQISPDALRIMITANCGQDALRYQIGHDHFHYDNNAFQAGDAYLEQMRRLIAASLASGRVLAAWQAFGRLLHAAQDFYAHSNFITLWRERYPDGMPAQIHPLLADVLNDVRLRSGRLYYPLEFLSFLPVLQPLVLPLLPRDSHAWMNKDDPTRSDFDFAYAAAVKRTTLEFEKMIQRLSSSESKLFTNQS
jgi:hypothetical protein